MKINHIGIWVEHLEEMMQFYVDFFDANPGPMYTNSKKQFSSYFLSLDDDCRIELMKSTAIEFQNKSEKQHIGYAHLAFSVGSKEAVDELTEKLRAAGFKVMGEARTTGDGYYESTVLDPEGNTLEITV